jgi:hypothetical protein
MGEQIPRHKSLVLAVDHALAEVVHAGESLEEGSAGDLSVATLGGRMQVRWDDRGQASAMGQLVFFAEFLDTSGLFGHWVAQCPLTYTSPNAPSTQDVLGSWMLSILDGHRRYAHLGSLRGDGVAPRILGMKKVIGDDSLRRALSQIAPASKSTHDDGQRAQQQAQLARAERWMQQQLMHSVQDALDRPWVLDCDTTIKPLYGHQAGAQVSYNPHKPGRPSHVVHTYWVGNLRLVLHAQLQGGNSHSSTHGLPGLKALLERLPRAQRPQLVRGDCGYGSDTVMRELEDLGQPYLFKLKQSAAVKKLVQQQWRRHEWIDAGQGWDACADELQLLGWQHRRRVIVLRRAVRVELLVESKARRGRKRKDPLQASLQFIDKNTPDKVWEYAVLVSNAAFPIDAMGQLYRDRADCENGFDELKNQWGWGGYTTQDIERCNLSAQAVGLVYNWWSWYVRLANPKARLEAITSRPLLLNAVGRLTQHAGQQRILLTVTHAAEDQVKALVVNIRKGLQQIRAAAPQFQPLTRWKTLVRYIVDHIMTATATGMHWRLALGSG